MDLASRIALPGRQLLYSDPDCNSLQTNKNSTETESWIKLKCIQSGRNFVFETSKDALSDHALWIHVDQSLISPDFNYFL